MSSVPSPQRSEVWLADLDPTFGHEQGGSRPVLIVSVDSFNAGLSGLAVVLPITSSIRLLPLHIPVNPPEGGLRRPSVILCDAIRSIDRRRLIDLWGSLNVATLAIVEDRLRRLLGL
ncbi:MAG TPA: type II toxin-antitoxin system PemK/MazF family toxin [Gemmataceae bacterium]|nr:type II toxin-antitoxin system PemK/MazF family toxin [Gemmataceae bacterium]